MYYFFTTYPLTIAGPAIVIEEDRFRFLDVCEKLQEMDGRRVSQEGWYETKVAQVVECQLRGSETLDKLLQVTEPCPNNCGMMIDKQLYLQRRRLHLYQDCHVQAAKNMLMAAMQNQALFCQDAGADEEKEGGEPVQGLGQPPRGRGSSSQFGFIGSANEKGGGAKTIKVTRFAN
eukprot:g14500.t1